MCYRLHQPWWLSNRCAWLEPGGYCKRPAGSLLLALEMSKLIPSANKSRGRPRIGATPVNVRFPPQELAALDRFMSEHPDKVTRPNAVRIIVADWLKAGGYLREAE